MITVIKRSGNKERFSAEKIRNTLAAASDENGSPLGSGDLQYLSIAVEKELESRETVSSREILFTLIDILRENGHNALADSYISYVTNQWK
jgi:transcriptional regulator NrdR family protein